MIWTRGTWSNSSHEHSCSLPLSSSTRCYTSFSVGRIPFSSLRNSCLGRRVPTREVRGRREVSFRL
jgi:hypothetical protein